MGTSGAAASTRRTSTGQPLSKRLTTVEFSSASATIGNRLSFVSLMSCGVAMT